MGPVIGVPTEVADTIKETTDLVEVDQVLPDVVDEPDLQLGSRPFGDLLLLTETPTHGYGPLIDVIVKYADKGPRPFELTVIDKDGTAHAFPAHTEPSADVLRQHLTSAFYGEPGDRRPLIRAEDSPPS
jgi:hypothetical protein